MIVKVINTEHGLPPSVELEVSDEDIVAEITTTPKTYFYALVDGKLFKSDERKGIKSRIFSSKEQLEHCLENALYWKSKLIPRIGCGVGYDTKDFYQKLIQTHDVEIKQLQL